MNITDFLSRLQGVKGRSPNWTARCPAHHDRDPSLSVTDAGDRILVKCHREQGCPTEAIVAAMGLELSDLFLDNHHQGGSFEIVATYDYTDQAGTLLFQVVRSFPKDFRQRRPDGAGGWVWNMRGVPRVLYRLPQVLAAVQAGKRVFVPEGEKDVAAIEAAGYTATCNPGGAGQGKWRPEHTETLRGADVIVVADRDESGYAHARRVARSLQGVAKRVVLVEPAVGKDVSDHLAAGRKLAELVPIPVEAPGTSDGEQQAVAPLAGSHQTASERNAGIREAALATLREVQRVASSWGWSALDRLLGAIVAGWLYMLGALSGNGKTTFLLNLLSRLWEDGIAVLYFGTEMAAEDLLKKWAALRLGLDELRVFEGRLSDEERDALEREMVRLMEAGVVTFSTVTRLDLRRLAAEIAWAFDARTGPRPRVVILDHLHFITQDREELEQLAKELKAIAMERRVAVIVAAQLNQDRDAGVFDPYTPPSLGRFKGSAAPGELADVALGLFRPLRPGMTLAQRRSVRHGEYPITDFAEPDTMGIVCVKHRFRGAAQGRFVSLALRGSRLESKAFAASARDPWSNERESYDEAERRGLQDDAP